MTFEDVWSKVKGLPKTAMAQVPTVLSNDTKEKLAKLNTNEVEKIVAGAIDEVNHGSILPLDTLIRQRL